MNIHIFGIAILLMSSPHLAVEEPKYTPQRTLLRKLQTYQPKESKPLMWNEVLADILVNKIKIFSFKKQAIESAVIKENLTEEKSTLTNFISQVLLVYKKFFYDVFVGPPITTKNSIDAVHLTPEIEGRDVDSDEMVKEHGVTFSDGPKGEVELVEPRYHGKQVLENGTGEGSGEVSDEIGDESVKKCGEGTLKVEGNCANPSKLMLAIPSQCPIGYRRDRLGFCRLMF